ncbi:hypothetical protein [Achromobacter insolitus]|uniref:hypothetical protein n=1 Tax=Achromobacter insolitus TaxID=217204 RepID=UPI000A88BF42|nr:hypothetical protein [Achromobacter insolitus]
MSNQSTKIERFELRLRPNIAAESALLDALEEKDGIYGGKTELLRECLRRGFIALGEVVDAQPDTASEEAVLNALAARFHGGEYSYRVGKLFLDARAAVGAEASGAAPVAEQRPTPTERAEQRSPSLDPASMDLTASEGAQMPASVPPEAPVSEPPAVAQQEPASDPSEPPSHPIAAPDEAERPAESPGVDKAASAARPRPSWGKLRGIAGSGDAGSDDK